MQQAFKSIDQFTVSTDIDNNALYRVDALYDEGRDRTFFQIEINDGDNLLKDWNLDKLIGRAIKLIRPAKPIHWIWFPDSVVDSKKTGGTLLLTF